MPAMPPRMVRVGAVVALVCLAAGVPRARAAWESSDGGVLMPGRDMQAVIQQALRRLRDERQAVDAEYSLAQRQCGAQRARASALLALVQDHEATVEDTDRELSELQLRALSVHRVRSATQLRQLSQELRLAREALGLGVGEAQGRPVDEDAAQELHVARGLIDGAPGAMTGGVESPADAAFLEVAQPADLAQLREQREAVRQMLRDVDGLVQHHDLSTSTENAFMRGAARVDLALLHDRVAVLERSVQLARDELAHVQHAIDREHAEMQHRAELAGSHRRLLQNVRLQQRLVEQLCALERETFVKQSTRRTEIISTLGAAADAITADDWSVQHIVEDAVRHARELQEQRGVAQSKAQKLMEEIMELEAEVAALRGRGALDLDVPQLPDSGSATGAAAQLRAEMRAEIRALEAKLPVAGEPAPAGGASGPGAGPRDGPAAGAADAADSAAGAASAAEGQDDPAIERLEAAMAASDAEAAPQLAASGGASAAIAELIPAAQEAGQQVTLALERVNAAEGEVRAAQEALAEAAGRRTQLQKDALSEAQRLQELKQSLQLADANIKRAEAVRDEAAAAEQAHRGRAVALDEKARALTRLLEDVRSRSIAFATGVASAETAAEPPTAALLELQEPQAQAGDPRLAVVVQQARGLGVELSETADASVSGDQLQAALFVTEQAAAKERQEARFSAERVATATSALQQATDAREAIARDIAVVEAALQELTAQIEAANAEVDGLAQRLREAQAKVRELAAEASEAGEHATELSNQLTAAMAGTVPAQVVEEEGAATGSTGDDAQAEEGATGGVAPEAAGEGEERETAAAEAPATGGHDAQAPTAAAQATGATGSSGEPGAIASAPAATAATGAGATGTADDGSARRAHQRRLRRERRREEREEEEAEKREVQAAREEAEKEAQRREAQAQEEAEKRHERELQEAEERRAERERAQRRAQEEAEKLEAELRSMTPEQAQAIVDHVNAVMNAVDASPSSSAAVKLSTSYSKVHYERALEILLHEATGDVLDAPTGAAPARSRRHGEGRASHEDTGAATASTGAMLQVEDSDDDDRKNEREPEHRHEGARESLPESYPEAEPESAAEDEQPAAEVGGATSGFGEAAMSTGTFQDEWERLHAAMERLYVARKVTHERMGTLRSFSGQANERTVLGQGEEAGDVWAPEEAVEEGDADAQSEEAVEAGDADTQSDEEAAEEGEADAQLEEGHAAEGHTDAQPDEAASEAAAEEHAATAVAADADHVTAAGDSASSTGGHAQETLVDREPAHSEAPASATGSAAFADAPEASTPEAAAVEEIHNYLLDHDIPVPESLFRLSKPATGGQGTVHFADVFTTPAPEVDAEGEAEAGVDYAESDAEPAAGADAAPASPTGGDDQAGSATATAAQADAGATGHASHAEAADAEPSADSKAADAADATDAAESAGAEAAEVDDGAVDTLVPTEEEHVPAEASVAPAAEPASPFAQDHSIYARPVEVNYEMFDQLTPDSKEEGGASIKAVEALSHGTKVTGVLRWAGATQGKSLVAVLSGSDNQEADTTSGHLVVRFIPDVQGHAAAVQWIYDADHSLCIASHPTFCLAEPTDERNHLVVVQRDNTRGLRGAGAALPAVAKWVFVMDGRLALERDSRLSMTVQSGHVAIAPAADTEPAFSGQQWLFDVAHGTKA